MKYKLCPYHEDSLSWSDCSDSFEGCEIEKIRSLDYCLGCGRIYYNCVCTHEDLQGYQTDMETGEAVNLAYLRANQVRFLGAPPNAGVAQSGRATDL